MTPAMATEPKQWQILLVEDDDIDALVIERLLHELRPDIQVSRSVNGEESLQQAQEKRPDLILMDIRMPLMDGREALTHLKRDPEMRDIPVVMMSTSSNDEDIGYCYRHHANAYMVKAMGLRESRQSVENLVRFWFDTAAH
ncbi:MAG: response regulator [Lysobacterales bacterium]